MPSGIILTSGSQGATEEDIKKVFESNGLETERPEPTTEKAEESEELEQAEQPAPGDEDGEPRRLSKTQKRIQKATAKLQAERDELAKRLEALEAAQPKKEEPPILTRPKRSDFGDDDKGQEQYEATLVAWAQMEKAAQDEQKAEREYQQRLQADWTSRVEAFKDEVDDYEEVLAKEQSLPMYQGVITAVKQLDNGPQVAYYLAKNPTFVRELSEMTPESAIVAVGRLGDKLMAASGHGPDGDVESKPKPKAMAPAPVRPVSTAATNASFTSREAAQQRDYKAFKRAQRQGR